MLNTFQGSFLKVTTPKRTRKKSLTFSYLNMVPSSKHMDSKYTRLKSLILRQRDPASGSRSGLHATLKSNFCRAMIFESINCTRRILASYIFSDVVRCPGKGLPMKTEREEEVKSSGPYLMICTLHTFLKHRPYAE